MFFGNHLFADQWKERHETYSRLLYEVSVKRTLQSCIKYSFAADMLQITALSDSHRLTHGMI